MACKSSETREGDQKQDDDLENAKSVLKTEAPFKETAVDNERKRNTGDANAALVPPGNILSSGKEDI